VTGLTNEAALSVYWGLKLIPIMFKAPISTEAWVHVIEFILPAKSSSYTSP